MAHELPPGEEPRWLDDPANGRKVFNVTVVLYVLFALIGFLPYEHHPHFPFEEIPVFHGIYGFVCFVGIVLVAKELRPWISRPEDYYDDE